MPNVTESRFMPLRRARIVLAALVWSAGVAAIRPTAAATPDASKPVTFTCPSAGLVTVAEDGAGKRRRTIWRGSDPNDPEVCLVDTPAARRVGTPERKLFGRWKQADVVLAGSEESVFRRSVSGLLRGTSPSAAFILRSNGEQVTQQWRVVESSNLIIGGQPIQTLKIRVDYTHSANTAHWYCDIWFAPSLNLFVKSAPSLEYLMFGADNSDRFTWSVVRISDKQTPE